MAKINEQDLTILTRRQGSNGNGASPNPLADYSPSVRVITQGRALSAQTMMGAIGRFDPDRITMKQRRQMAADPMIGLALNFLRVLLIGADYHFESTDPQLVAFIDNCYRRIHAKLISELMMALPYGYAGIVQRFQLELPDWQYEDDKGKLKQVWPEKKIQAVTWNQFENLPPEGLRPVFKPDGKTFDGMEHNFLRPDEQTPGPLRVPVTHSLWYTHNREAAFGDWYGIPRTRAAFRYWWSYWYQWLLADRHAEQDADPPLVVGVPEGEMVPDPDNSGAEITSQELGMRIGQYLRDGATIVLPTDTYEDAEGKPTATRKWTADFLRGGENLAAFRANFEYMDVMKIRGTLVPESALVSAGGRNTMLVAVQSLEKSLEQLSDEIDQLVNDYLIPPLLQQNFVNPASVRKITTGFREEDLTLPKQILTILTQADPSSLSLDVRKLAHQVGLPLKPAGSEPDVQQPTGNLPALPGQASPNAPQGGAPGGNNNPAGGFRGPGGQTAQTESRANQLGGGGPGSRNATGSLGGQPVVGVPRGGQLRIDGQPFSFGFSLDQEDSHAPDPAAAALPDTPHFADPEVRGHAEDLLSVLDSWFTDLYGEAADHVEQHLSHEAQRLIGGGVLALAGDGWNPDLHPRDAHGRFTEVAHIIDALSQGGSADYSFLARGARNIQGVTASASPDGQTLHLQVRMPDGVHTIDAPRDVNFSHVMQGLKQLDSGTVHAPQPHTEQKAAQIAQGAPVTDQPLGDVERLADALRQRAEQYEPPISKDLQALAKANHGELQSFDKRFKEQPTIAEKLLRKAKEKTEARSDGHVVTPQEYSRDLADALRYTMTTSSATHTEDVKRILADLRSKGYEIAPSDLENSWDRADYKGINLNITSPDGYKFEMQFHTPQSLKAKREAHGYYEEQRLVTTPEAKKRELEQKMAETWRAVPEPKGIRSIGVLQGERGKGTPDPRSPAQRRADVQRFKDAMNAPPPPKAPKPAPTPEEQKAAADAQAAAGQIPQGAPDFEKRTADIARAQHAAVAAPDARSATQKAADQQLQKDTAAAQAADASPPAAGGAEKPPLTQLPEPPKLEWREPPKPQGKKGERKAGGFTATGHTNTALGDLAEKAVRELGLRSLLPAGKRQNPLDAAFGDYGFEIKAVTTRATEYKAKPKAHEVQEKLAYAKANGLKPGLMIVVYDGDKGEFHAYWTEGIGAYTLTQGRFHYMGTVSEKGLQK